MKCIVQGCPGEMEERRIMHTFVRGGRSASQGLVPLIVPLTLLKHHLIARSLFSGAN